MKEQAAYSLLWLGGKKDIKIGDVKDFMKKSGVSVDDESLDAFFKCLEGKDVAKSCADGSKKLVKMGGGGGARPAAAGGAGAAAAEVKKEEEKKEEEEDVDMGGLFGDDDDY